MPHHARISGARRLFMPGVERFRQLTSGPLDFEAFQQRIREGWKLVAFEWEREAAMAPATEPTQVEQVPFGAQLAPETAGLAQNPTEMEALFRMMELIVEEVPYSYIADELNRAGFRTRSGRRWSSVSIFEMLPRLIEVGPTILFSDEWRRRRLGSVRMESPRG